MTPTIVVLPHPEGPRILVFESDVTEVYDAAANRLAPLPPARDAVTADVDGDGAAEVVLCGVDGVVILGWDREHETLVLDPQPCARIGAVGDTLVIVGTHAQLYALPGLTDRGAWGSWLDGEPLLATSATGFAVGSTRSTTLTTRNDSGKGVIATGEPPRDLVLTAEGPVWLTADRATDALFRDRPAGPAPERLLAVETSQGRRLYALDADGALRDLDAQAAVVSRGPFRAVAPVDVDRDGCDDLATLSDAGVEIVPGPGCAAPIAAPSNEPPVAPPTPRPRPPPVFGLRIPPSLGRDPDDQEPFHWSDRYVGVGGAIANGLPGMWPFVPVFPALAFESVWGGPRIRGLFGVDSSGFLVWIGSDVAVLHLLNTTYGVVLGGRDLQFGPIVTLGLVNAGLGFRTAFTPIPVQRGLGRMGIETRIIAFAGGAGETDLLWVWRSPGRRERRQLTELGKPLCASLGFLVGAAGGFSSTQGAWQYVGTDQAWAPTISPFIGASCEADGFMLGLETAPAFRWLIPPSRDRVHHMASHTFGPMFERGDVRFGPIGQVGVWTAGLGGRLAWTPTTDRNDRAQGLELRALALFPYAPAWEFTAAWGIWTDPRR